MIMDDEDLIVALEHIMNHTTCPHTYVMLRELLEGLGKKFTEDG
jgi:hypothetical protein